MTGCWIVWDYAMGSGSHGAVYAVFDDELEARRYAMDHAFANKVKFLEWGQTP